MLPPLPLLPSLWLCLALVAGGLPLVLGLGLPPRARRWLRAFGMVLVLALGFGFWAWNDARAIGVLVVWSALPVALLLRRWPRRAPPTEMAGAKLSRRAALGIPITAGAAAATGFAQGSALAELKPLSLLRPDLPSDLAGLTILQLSDLHLGTGLDQPHLERLVETLWPLRPDLVVLTGDVADRSEALAGALPAIESLRPRFGTYAVLGNHEYLSGELEAMLEIYRASGVRLLVNETELVRVGRARLAIVGIDDPFGKESGFFERALAGCDPGPCAADFRLLLSHRPEAFTLAARRGIDLTLSGHTHGGQIGWWGRSAVELVGLARYMWGWYRSGASTLYTSAGAGDWFPFRVGCPREAPLIVLRAGRNRG